MKKGGIIGCVVGVFVVVVVVVIIGTATGVSLGLLLGSKKAQLLGEAVDLWGYQIQGISEDGTVDALVASHYDMLVLEPTRSDKDESAFDAKGMVDRLHASESNNRASKLVIAYVDIGEAEDWRWYWDAGWILPTGGSRGTPDFLVCPDPDGWSGNFPVAYWDPAWKDIMLYSNNSSIRQVIDDGFDGIYMDWVEGFENVDVAQAAIDDGTDAHVEMLTFIAEIRTFAKALNPDFLIIPQNSVNIVEGDVGYYDIIDAIAQEQIMFDGSADVNWGDPAGGDDIVPENDSPGYSTEWYSAFLDQYLDHGIPVFVVDYALNTDNADASYAYAKSKGYVGFVSQRSLSQLPVDTQPPNY